jgi:hypothetical protein
MPNGSLRSVWVGGKDRGPVIGSEPKDSGSKSISTLVNELTGLIVAYFRQQTVVPIQSLGRYVIFGFLGAILMSVGGGLLALAVVRLLQAETGRHLTGSLTWASYAGGMIVAGGGAALAVSRIGKGSARKVKGRSPS